MKPALLTFLFSIVFTFLSYGTNCVIAPSGVDTTSAAYNDVIANDPFCCSTMWDGICQNAYDNFGSTGGGSGECITAPAEVDTDSEAYTTVIANDPFCCNNFWDGICQSAYNNLINGGSEEDDDDECVSPPASVDVNSDAYATVIANDTYCCDYFWDGMCQSAYDDIIGSGGGDDEEDDCVSAPSTVDVDSEAYQTVITNDPFCCNVMWDGICQNAYNSLVGADDEDEEGDTDCVEAPETVDMDSEAYATVIANDPFCCNYTWDGICQNAYNNLLNEDDEEGPDCVGPPEGVDTNSDAYATLIAIDPFCCNYWDTMCQIQYDSYSGSIDESGECAAEFPASIDVNSDAFEQVITNDPFCCNNMWDSICQNAYDNYSEGGIIENPGDGSIGGLLDNEFGFSFFPNPANDQITLTFESVNADYPIGVRLYNGLGQIVLVQGNIQIEQMHQVQIDVSNLGSGFYLVVVNNGDEMMSRQLVVK